MHFEADQIIYSPSDLTLYMESPFCYSIALQTLSNVIAVPPSISMKDSLIGNRRYVTQACRKDTVLQSLCF